MLASAAIGKEMNWPGALFFAGFFTLHYGIFCYVHGTFVVALFGAAAVGDNMLDMAGAMQGLFAQHPNLAIGLASIALWQVVVFVRFLIGGEAATANPMALMRAPYPRIIVLHVTIIFGGFLLMMLNQPVAGLVLLALIKMTFDIFEALGHVPDFTKEGVRKTRSGGDHPGSFSGPSTRR
jgi:hypothetical protein